MVCLVLEVAGHVLGFLGLMFLLKEPMRFRLEDESLKVDTDKKGYKNRLRVRKVGIILLAMGFALQLVA